MIKVGLTGGIGSGKTTISKLFKELGIPVFNSDLCARNAEKEPTIMEGFKSILGDDIFIDGELDRPKMRSIIFVDKEKLSQVNTLVIPYIKMKFNQFQLESNAPYVVLESAILFETKGHENFDHIITVTADEDTRIKRVVNRDNASVEEIMNKLNNQWPEQDKIAQSDFIVFNNGDDLIDSLDVLTKQVNAIDKAIRFDAINDCINRITNGKI